jgi:acyl dehydratase
MIKIDNFSLEEIHVGQESEFKVIISKSMIEKFAELSGDYNPLHTNESYSKEVGFQGIVCHGMLLASLFSRLVGMYLPGKKALYLSQSLKFLSPCYINDEIMIKGKILKKSISSRIITLETKIIKNNDTNVVIGEAKVLVKEK